MVEKRHSDHYVGVLACLGAASSALNAGFAISFSSPAIQQLQAGAGSIELSPEGATWFGSLLPLMAMWGSLLSGPLMDQFGRRPAVLTAIVCFLVSWIAIFLSSGYILLFSGRGLSGLATGMSTAIIPVYISEVSPSFLRGTMGSAFSVLLALGLPIGYASGVLYSWRGLAQLGAVLACMTFIVCFTLPESPYWLVRQNKVSEASECIKRLRGKSYNAAKEVKDIQCLQEDLNASVTMKEIVSYSFLKPIGIGVTMMVFQQFSGVNAIFFYAHEIFQRTNFQNESLASILVSSMHVAALFIVTFIVDRIGRRKLLLISGLGMMICHSVIGGCMYVLSDNEPVYGHGNAPLTNSSFGTVDVLYDGKNANSTTLSTVVAGESASQVLASLLSLIFVMLYITLYSVGLGPVPYIALSEMLPQRGRGVAGGIGTMSNWICAFILTKTFVSLVDIFSASGVFWIFSFICILSAVFVCFCVPETRGKTLSEIQGIFNDNNNLACSVGSEKRVVRTPLRIIHQVVAASPVGARRSPSMQEQTQYLMD